MSLILPEGSVRSCLVFLGVDLDEGADPNEVLDETLDGFNLTRDEFLTPATLFGCGYHRGLQAASFTDDQVPANGEGPDKDLTQAMENGYVLGMEARDLSKAPPPSLVFEALKNGDVEWGSLSEWASGLDLSDTHRLGVALEVGSGKTAVIIPAGTPVDVIGDTEKDGVPHKIVGYDGVALIVPDPEDAPNLVSGDTDVAPAKKKRGSRKSKASGEKRERGPNLKTAIIQVFEGDPGPLANDGAIAGRVLVTAREMGIGDKAARFVQKAAKHVPYYLNCYKPNSKDNSPGRLGVEAPLDRVCAAIEARKYYLRAEGTHEERLEAIPTELRERMEDAEKRLETTAPPVKEKKDKDEDKDEAKGGDE